MKSDSVHLDRDVPILRPDLILIGSMGRDSGKTEFACALIRHYAPFLPVVGVKITSITEAGGSCPRGGQSCGICTSLEGRFAIMEECDATLSKDTSRMLRAGAHRVIWLRVFREYLREGVEALLAGIPGDSAIICESNAARSVLEPGVFLMLRAEGSTTMKPSARELLPLADRIVTFHGNGWDFPPGMCTYRQGEWSMSIEDDEPIKGERKAWCSVNI